MRRSLLLVALLAWGAPATSQSTSGMAAGGMDCRMLAAMPNAPMTVEACERQFAAYAQLMSALDTPGGERPGDERMTCATIADELKAMKVAGVSPANAAEGKAAGEDMMAVLKRAQAQAMGLAASQTARTAATAAVPGVGGAAAAANLAEQKALQERVAAELNPARRRVTEANMNSMNDLARSMRENPRFARLIKLAIERNCQYD
jgi:hypothetical protein